MSATAWLVSGGGAATIAWVNWYFFVAGRGVVPAQSVAAPGAGAEAGTQAATIVVEGGYTPSTIRARAGQPITLTFDRRDASSCAEEVVFPAFGIRRFLPLHEQTSLVVTPPTAGTYEFTCGMSMLHGRIIAE